MFINIFRWLAVLSISICIFACGSETDVDGDQQNSDGDSESISQNDGDVDLESMESDPDAKIEISGLSIVENPANCLSFYVDWTTDLEIATQLNVNCNDGYNETFSATAEKTGHSVFVMGLLGGSECIFQAMAKDADGAVKIESRNVTVKEVPEPFPAIELVEYVPQKMQPGWTIFNLVATWDNKPLSIAMVDQKGRYRWYYKVPTQFTGADNEVQVLDDGILIGGTSGNVYPQLISWEGKQKWKAEFYMHHDILPWGENQYLYLGLVNSCSGDVWDNADYHYSCSMHIWDVETRKKVWTWSLCDHYVPENIVEDWSHLNAIYPFAGENAVLLSSRDQNALFKINMDNGEILWQMGENGDFEMSDEDLFFGQHAPEILENNNILLFDNGDTQHKVRSYSRAIEIQYDEENMTAEVVWEYRHKDMLCKMWGDADRLENGNVLVTFGKDYGITSIVEVTHEEKPQLLWEISPAKNWGVYRSDRIVDPPKGYVIE